MANRVGQQLGNYRLLRLLGRGGFAEVYLGEHVYLKRRAALKVLHTLLEEEDIDPFLAEAQLLARLDHPHIVRVHDFAVEQGTPFLAMDYALHGTLRQRHPRGSCLSLATTVTYVKQIAAALQYAHTHNIVHRDIKPENVLVGASQDVLLSDFGLSLFTPSQEQLSRQDMAGTLPYMAPEQIEGHPRAASDQYSLAIVVYEWLCGVRPFEGSPIEVMVQQLTMPPPALRDKDSSLPEPVEVVVLRALAKAPQDRYENVQLFSQALEQAIAASLLDQRVDLEMTVPAGSLSTSRFVIPRRVFLSASHADHAFVTRLKTDLEQCGIAWEEGPAPTQLTREHEDPLRQAIRAADALLVVLSPAVVSSRTIKEHLRIASLYQRQVLVLWAAGEEMATSLLREWGKTDEIDLVDARDERYEQALEEVLVLLEQDNTPQMDPVLPEAAFAPRSPYKGLHAFTEEDASDFFGREVLSQELVEQVKRLLVAEQPAGSPVRLLTVIGPSGSGKSSVVMAGLLPRLRQGAVTGSEHWVYLKPLVPGTRALEALSLTLAPCLPDRSVKSLREDLEEESARGLHLLATQLVQAKEQQVVLVVDQLEELFTQTSSEQERQQFIDLLVTAVTEPHGPVVVVLTIRADFYDRPLAYQELGRLITRHQVVVLPMEVQDLRAVIKGPAALSDVQLSFEGNLVGDLLFEMKGQAGALPLLEFTLEQLFERRSDHRLTLSAYREIGGVKGALSQHAEQTYAGLPSEEHRRLARALFLRLIDPGATEQDTTRRRAALSELLLPEAKQTAIMREAADTFIAARLLTTSEVAGTTTVEVSHEALIREWARLTDWLREAREDIRLQQTLSEDAAEWQRRKQPTERLYRGTQLKEAQAWARRNVPSGNEMAFLRASADRRMRSAVSVLAALLLMVTSIATAGWLLTHQAPRLPDPTHVTNLADHGPGSLRQAVDTSPPGSMITFDAHLSGTISLTSGDLNIAKNLVIRGPVGRTLTVSSGDSGHVVHVVGGVTVSISNLNFQDSTFQSPPSVNGFVFNEGTLIVSNSAVSNNTGGNGGIYNTGALTLSNSTVSGNTQGIHNTGTLTLSDSTVSDNTTQGCGGGIANDGGGRLTLSNSTVAHNSGSCGGGIFNDGTLNLSNSSVSDNTSKFDSGGGIQTAANSGPSGASPPHVNLLFCTIYGNSAPVGADLAIKDVGPKQLSQVVISDSIIAGDPAHPHPDISGMLISFGYNLFQDNSGATFDASTSHQLGTDKTLSVNDLTRLFVGPVGLRDNGGPTRTYELGSGSPAIDQIPLSACHRDGITTDQRGVKRPDGNELACDIGAYESTD